MILKIHLVQNCCQFREYSRMYCNAGKLEGRHKITVTEKQTSSAFPETVTDNFTVITVPQTDSTCFRITNTLGKEKIVEDDEIA